MSAPAIPGYQLDHHGGAAEALLARLEHEDHASWQVLPVCSEDPGRTDQAGGVQVVPTGVHAPIGGGELQAGLLGHRQGIHVSAQQYRRTGSAAA